MNTSKASLVLVAAILGCSPSLLPSDLPGTPNTRAFSYRGGVLGGECSAAREFEAAVGGSELHDTADGLDQYGFIASQTRSALLVCRNGVLCSQSVTHFLPNPAEASRLCAALRSDFESDLGRPSFDTHSESFRPPPDWQDVWDSDVMRPAIWTLNLSELTLDCPLGPDGDGFWTVSTSHSTNPQLKTEQVGPQTIVVTPARACLQPN